MAVVSRINGCSTCRRGSRRSRDVWQCGPRERYLFWANAAWLFWFKRNRIVCVTYCGIDTAEKLSEAGQLCQQPASTFLEANPAICIWSSGPHELPFKLHTGSLCIHRWLCTHRDTGIFQHFILEPTWHLWLPSRLSHRSQRRRSASSASPHILHRLQ